MAAQMVPATASTKGFLLFRRNTTGAGSDTSSERMSHGPGLPVHAKARVIAAQASKLVLKVARGILNMALYCTAADWV